MSYEGYLTDSSDEALTGTYSMVFSLYSASTGGAALWTETQPTVSVTNGYFSVQLGSVSAINLDFDQQYYLGINVGGDGEMTPRYALNSTAYAKSADIAFGVFADADAPSAFDGALYYDTDNGSIYIYDGIATAWQEIATGSGGVDDLDDAYNNFGAAAAKITIDASESQTGGLEFESSIADNIIFDLQSTGDIAFQDAGTTFLTFNDDDSVDYTTDLTTTDAWQLAGNSLTSGDLLQLSATSLEGGDAIQITTNGTATGYAINVVSGDVLLNDDLLVGANAETLANASFTLGGDDLFVSDDFGIEGDIYSDGSIIFGSGLTLTSGSFTQATGGPLAIALGGAAGDDFTVDSTTLVVESDNNRVGIGDASPAALFTVGSGDLFQVDTSGNVTTTARVDTAAHANNVGLNVPTNAGAPAAVTGTSEGDIVWDSTNDALYLYDGAAFSEIGAGGGGGDAATLDTLDSLQFLRADTSDSFTGTRLTFNDNAILSIGTGNDFSVSHDATNSLITSTTGDLTIDNTNTTGSTIFQLGTDTSATSLELKNNTGTQLLTALGSGNIGIGDTTPDQLLEIMSSGAAATQMTIANTNAGDFDTQVGFQLVDGTNNFTIGVDDSDSDKFKITTGANFDFADFVMDGLAGISMGDLTGTYNNFGLKIDNDTREGVIKIGDTFDGGFTVLTIDNQTSEFEFYSPQALNTQVTIANTNAGDYDPQIGFQLVDGTNAWTIGVDDSDSDKFKIIGSNAGTNFEVDTFNRTVALGDVEGGEDGYALLIDDGNQTIEFGDLTGSIGTSKFTLEDFSNGSRAEVSGSGTAGTQFNVLNTYGGSADAQIGFQLVDGTNNFTIGVDDSDSDKFKISRAALGTNDALTIDSSGRVGIGGYSASAGIYIQSTDDIFLGDPNEDSSGMHLNIDADNEYVGLGDPYIGSGGQLLEIDGDTLWLGDSEEKFLGLRSDVSDEQLILGQYNSTTSNMRNSIILDRGAVTQLYGDLSPTDGIYMELQLEEKSANFIKTSTSVAGYVVTVDNRGGTAAAHGIIVDAGADDGTGTTYYIRARDGDGTDVGYLQNSGGTFSVQDVSDVRTKTNITDTEVQGLDVVNNLRVVDFNRISNPDGERITGFIAQELQPVYDKIVSTGPDGFLSISKENLVPVLVKGMQEQQVQINDIQAQIDAIDQTSSRQSGVSVASGEFSSSNVGRVKMLAGDTSAHVTFDTPFRYDPIITVSPIGIHNPKYAADNITTEGFDLVINTANSGDIIFNWHAFSSEKAKIYVSDGTSDYLDLQVKYNEESTQEEDVENVEEIDQDEDSQPASEDEPSEETTPQEQVEENEEVVEDVPDEPIEEIVEDEEPDEEVPAGEELPSETIE
jgi:hypothetical protein